MPPVIDVARARDRRQRGGDEAAGARLRRRERPAERAAAVEHDLLHPPPVARVEEPPQPLRERVLELEQPLLGARLGDEVDVDLEAAGADRHLEPVAVAARLLEGLRDLGLAGAEEAQRLPQRRRAPVEHAADLRGFERPRPEPLQLDGRAGQHDHRRPVRLDDEAGRGAGEAEDRGRLRHRRLLRHAVREVRVGPLHPLGDHPRDAFDLRLELGVHADGEPGDLRHDPDRAVVVRRPEPARRRDQVGRRHGLGDRSLELGRIVADDVDPGRLDPEREQRPRQERPVQVGALAAHELAARDDDDRAWSRAVRARQAASAAKIFFAVTKTPCALTAAGSRTRLPLRRTSTFCGDSSRTQSTWPSNRCFWPRSSVPW